MGARCKVLGISCEVCVRCEVVGVRFYMVRVRCSVLGSRCEVQCMRC